jgi:hypothetical protein
MTYSYARFNLYFAPDICLLNLAMRASWRHINPPRRRIAADTRRRIAAVAREGAAARRATHAWWHEWRGMRPQCGVSGVGGVRAGHARGLVIRLCWLRGRRGSQRVRRRRAVHGASRERREWRG